MSLPLSRPEFDTCCELRVPISNRQQKKKKVLGSAGELPFEKKSLRHFPADLPPLIPRNIPGLSCTHFLFRKVSRPSAEILSGTLLSSVSTQHSSQRSEMTNTRKTTACNPENRTQAHLKYVSLPGDLT